MTSKEKEILKEKIQYAVFKAIIYVTTNDDEFILGLKYADEKIKDSLAYFTDIMDEED